MPSLVNSGDRVVVSGIFNDIFETFKRDIVIWKEPVKTVTTINESYLYGYGDPANLVNYTNAPVSGVFPAVVKYNDEMGADYDANTASYFPEGYARIKVLNPTKQFLESGKTERIDIDGKSFNVASEVTPKKFLSSEFYVYHLKEIK